MKCKGCNKTFSQNWINQKYCSAKCRTKNNYKKNRLKILQRCQAYTKLNKESKKLYDKLYYLKNKNKIKERNKKYNKNHKQFFRNKYVNNLNFRLLKLLRGRMWKALKRNSKSLETKELLGCSVEFLQVYLAFKFKSGMSWANYGKWHIDHKIPCSKFDLTKESEQRKCFNFNNLQPLWAKDNLEKHDKITTD